MLRRDCWDRRPKSLFGFVTKVMLVENQPCILNVTCDINGYKIRNTTQDEGVNSPKGILTASATNIHYLFSNRKYKNNENRYHEHKNINRQTGEIFSANDPTCRANMVAC